MLNELFNRAQDVGHSRPTVNPKQRLAERAESINRSTVAQARLDVATMATAALIKLLYETDGTHYPNIDTVTGRILVPVPWGASGWNRWCMRKWEAECLRKILMNRCRTEKNTLFDYGDKQWFIDMQLYPTLETALYWLQHNGPTLNEWLAITDWYRTRKTTPLV